MRIIGIVMAVLVGISVNFTAVIPIAQAPSLQVTPVNAEKVSLVNSELKKICACESAGNRLKEPRHYDALGNVLVSQTRDVGLCQINLDAHEKAAKEMGLDLFSEEDNILYANWLYGTKGANHWAPSFSCWKIP